MLEALEQPIDLVLAILGMRAYAEAKRTLDTAESEADIPDSALMQTVKDLTSEYVIEHGRT